jgi:hypothetical protein
MRYYGYLGTSSTAKSAVLTATEFSDGSPGSWPMDSRLKATDNFTVTGLASNLGAGDGSITHLIICPGNEAGDATSCASSAINDRGLGAVVTWAIDNVTRVFITPGASTSFEVVTADGSSDNVTATQAVTDTKSTTAGSTTFGTASTVVTEATGFSAVMDSLIHGSTLYTLTAKDNGTLTACTSGSCSTSSTSIFGTTVDSRIVLDSDGTNMIGIADNGTLSNAAGTGIATGTDNYSTINVFNLTIPGTPVRVGSSIARDDNTTSSVDGQFCGAVGGGRAVVFTDNQSSDMAGSFYATGMDNTTGWDLTGTTAVLDNATAGVSCAMTYGGISGVTRTFYMAVDNNTSTLLYSIVDNTTTSGTSTGSPALTVSLVKTVANTTAESDLAIDADSAGVPYMVIDNATGGAILYRSITAEHLGALGIHGPLDVAVGASDIKVGVAGISTDAAAGTDGYPRLRVWYKE